MSYQPTSRLAYQEVKKTLGERQQQVLAALLAKPDQTNAELAKYLGLQINQVTPRVLELRKFKKVRLLRHRKCRVTGSTAMAWEPTEPSEQLALL
jgi:hypothetical protein